MILRNLQRLAEVAHEPILQGLRRHRGACRRKPRIQIHGRRRVGQRPELAHR
jgi:hypothetical protein